MANLRRTSHAKWSVTEETIRVVFYLIEGDRRLIGVGINYGHVRAIISSAFRCANGCWFITKPRGLFCNESSRDLTELWSVERNERLRLALGWQGFQRCLVSFMSIAASITHTTVKKTWGFTLTNNRTASLHPDLSPCDYSMV